MTALLLDDPQGIHRPENSLPPQIEMALEDLQIVSEDDANTAGSFLNQIQELQKQITEKFAEPVKKAHEAHKALTSWRAQCLLPLERAEAFIKTRIGGWHQGQERLRQLEERRLQAEADERAKAEARRIEEEAKAQAEQLKTQGRVDEAEALIQQAPEIARQVIETAAPVSLPKTQIYGVSLVDNWQAEVTNLQTLVEAAAKDHRLLPYVMANESVLNKTAKALRGAMIVPGVRVFNDPGVRGGRRK